MFSIYLVKVTRRPVFVKHISSFDTAELESVTCVVNAMQPGGLAPSGISVQLVHAENDAVIKKIECGDLKQHGIKVIHQVNGV